MLGKQLAIAQKLGCLCCFISTSEAAWGACRNTSPSSMFQATQGMGHSCNEMLAFYMENTLGRTSLMGGDPFVAKKKVPFCTNRSKKSISLGNLTVLSLQTKKHLLRHTRIVHSCVFMFWVCIPFSFDEKLLEIFYAYVLAT